MVCYNCTAMSRTITDQTDQHGEGGGKPVRYDMVGDPLNQPASGP